MRRRFHVVVQVVSRLLLNMEARICVRVSPCGICGGQCGGNRFSPSSLAFPYKCNSKLTIHDYDDDHVDDVRQRL
jgi:hypothetical protein